MMNLHLSSTQLFHYQFYIVVFFPVSFVSLVCQALLSSLLYSTHYHVSVETKGFQTSQNFESFLYSV